MPRPPFMRTYMVNGVPYSMRADMPAGYKQDLSKQDPLHRGRGWPITPLTDGPVIADERRWYAVNIQKVRNEQNRSRRR